MALINLFLGLLVIPPTIFAAAPYGNVLASDVARTYIDDIEKYFKIAPDNPPAYKLRYVTEPTCFAYWGSCDTTYFHLKNTFVNGTAKAFYVPYTEYENANVFSEKSQMTITQSTAIVLGTSKGWNAAAKWTVSGDARGQKAALEVSGGYSSTTTGTTTTTKTVSTHAECRYGYICEIQTWTFHVLIDGMCKTRPYLNCGSEKDACKRRDRIRCKQQRTYIDKFCNHHRLSTMTPCSASMVVRNAAGEPFTTLALVSSRINSDGIPATAKRDNLEDLIVEILN
ncbi:uncharacterized protein G6M90_00g066590 [Metarhizium brunneum]|uniref:Uncharacterized protein n=1 Tax=Metarhizium brunneum TaxID=500148 RepID=A0A7D5YTC9_9HYPO